MAIVLLIAFSAAPIPGRAAVAVDCSGLTLSVAAQNLQNITA
jgi:hypothetical protein